jgi:hypothetical protein
MKNKKALILIAVVLAILGAINFGIYKMSTGNGPWTPKPDIYIWNGKIAIPTMYYEEKNDRNNYALASIPYYCQPAVNSSWDQTYQSNIEFFTDKLITYDWYNSEASLGGYTAKISFTTNKEASLIISRSPDFPSKTLEEAYLNKALTHKDFRLHWVEIDFDGYNPEALTSTATVHCAVRTVK